MTNTLAWAGFCTRRWGASPAAFLAYLTCVQTAGDSITGVFGANVVIITGDRCILTLMIVVAGIVCARVTVVAVGSYRAFHACN